MGESTRLYSHLKYCLYELLNSQMPSSIEATFVFIRKAVDIEPLQIKNATNLPTLNNHCETIS